ncbi:MAG: hypothetical protein AAGD01_18525 [Acidobacteriota bacterium]
MKDILVEKRENVARLDARRTKLKKEIEEIQSLSVNSFDEFLTKVLPILVIQVGFSVFVTRMAVPWYESLFGVASAEGPWPWPLFLLAVFTFFAAMTLVAWVYLKIRSGPLTAELERLESRLEAARIDLARIKRQVEQ